MSADQLPQTVAELSQAYDARALSPVEYVAHLVDRIDRTDGILHAFVERTIDQARIWARIWARLSEQRLMCGSRLGPLDGVPIAHKDNIDTAGVATTANCGLFRNRVPARDAAVVAALARSGAVMLGKVGCYEAAFGGPDFDLSWPVPRNPWDLGRSTAGSSSGSAVAIAAGVVLAATGSDTGGSLRDPAALCGVTGYKPRYRTIPTTGMFPFAPSLDTIGPMAKNPEDALIMAAAMRGERADAGPLTAPARGLRIGVVPRWSEDIKVDDGVGAVFDTAVAALRGSGAEIVTIDLPPLRDFASTGWTIAMAELRETHAEAWAHGADGIGPMLRRGLAAADVIPAFRYIAALRHARALTGIVEQACEDIDVLLTPAQDSVAQPLAELGGALPFEKPSITIPFFVTGAAAVVMPAGLHDRLPIGVQFASMKNEALLFRAACALDRALGNPRFLPPAFS